jgi:tetratricopeptide (TPR) repeat protein
VGDWLREHWDFGDLDATEVRFGELLASTTDGGKRAEILTQLARVHGLRGDFEGGERLVREAETGADESARAHVLVDLERGRLRRSGGDASSALPLFERAFERAAGAGEHFLAADAAHMAALAAPDEAAFGWWTDRGIAYADTHEPARYWLGPLLNNLGWQHYDAGAYADALAAFGRALDERERDPSNTDALRLAHYAVAKTLRALGRPADALEHAEWAVESAASEGTADGWFHEELAETYAALGRDEDAATHAAQALVLLPEADDSFEPGGGRAMRLREYAEAGR